MDNSNPGSFTMTTCWTKSFNKSNEFSIPFTALPKDSLGNPCNNVVPESGITSTPVIDTSVTPPVMYVVTGHQTATSTYTYRLHVLRLNSGTEPTSGNGPYDLVTGIHSFPNGSSFVASGQNQRVGLAMYKTKTSSGAAAANIYVGFGSFCDTNPAGGVYSGYIAGFQFVYGTLTFSTIGLFNTQASTSTPNQGGIWMGGGAPVLDANNNLYVAVGNGDFNGGSTGGLPTDFGESMVKLVQTSSNLVPVDFYTPNDWVVLNSGQNSNQTVCLANSGTGTCPPGNSISLPGGANGGDFDLGSGGVTLINPVNLLTSLCPSNQELVAGGKEGVLYGTCYSTSTSSSAQSVMGGLDNCGYNCSGTSNTTATACTQSTTLPAAGSIAQCFPGVTITGTVSGAPGSRATAAFWAGNASNTENWLYIAGAQDALRAYNLNTSTGLFNTTAAVDDHPRVFGYPGATPSVSWDPSSPNSALLWAVDAIQPGQWNNNNNNATTLSKAAVLVVYPAVPTSGNTTLKELWSSSVNNAATGPGTVKYAVPTVANGMVFVARGQQ